MFESWSNNQIIRIILPRLSFLKLSLLVICQDVCFIDILSNYTIVAETHATGTSAYFIRLTFNAVLLLKVTVFCSQIHKSSAVENPQRRVIRLS